MRSDDAAQRRLHRLDAARRDPEGKGEVSEVVVVTVGGDRVEEGRGGVGVVFVYVRVGPEHAPSRFFAGGARRGHRPCLDQVHFAFVVQRPLYVLWRTECLFEQEPGTLQGLDRRALQAVCPLRLRLLRFGKELAAKPFAGNGEAPRVDPPRNEPIAVPQAVFPEHRLFAPRFGGDREEDPSGARRDLFLHHHPHPGDADAAGRLVVQRPVGPAGSPAGKYGPLGLGLRCYVGKGIELSRKGGAARILSHCRAPHDEAAPLPREVAVTLAQRRSYPPRKTRF